MTEKKYYKIASLEKGIRILELLAAHGELSVTKVAELMDTIRAGSHRFIATLRDLGYVEKTESNKYQATLKVLQVAMKVANRFEIRRIARPYMQKLSLKYRETINLGFFNGVEIIHIDKIDSHEILRMDSDLGEKAPAYCTGLGKAILAFLSDYERDAYLDNTVFVANTPNTIIKREDFLQELSAVRQKGYAVDDEELARGLRCVAAPVFDHDNHPAYAVSISGPAMRLTHRVVENIKESVLEVSKELSRHMGTPEST